MEHWGKELSEELVAKAEVEGRTDARYWPSRCRRDGLGGSEAGAIVEC